MSDGATWEPAVRPFDDDDPIRTTRDIDKCHCENTHCETCRGDGCNNRRSETVVCDYIGNICDDCAESMPDRFLHRVRVTT